MRLRPATTHDSDFLLMLKNDPVMRRFSVVTHDEIKKVDHLKWLKKHLKEIWIIVHGVTDVGMLRISKEKEISINICPEWRGKGVGFYALQFCTQNVWAKIVNGNVASMRLFLSAGFKITGYENNYYILRNDT